MDSISSVCPKQQGFSPVMEYITFFGLNINKWLAFKIHILENNGFLSHPQSWKLFNI